MQEYDSWKLAGVRRPSEGSTATIDDVRRSGRFAIVTAAEARALLGDGGKHNAVLHPLVGGVPLEAAWASLRRFVEQVLQPARKRE